MSCDPAVSFVPELVPESPEQFQRTNKLNSTMNREIFFMIGLPFEERTILYCDAAREKPNAEFPLPNHLLPRAQLSGIFP